MQPMMIHVPTTSEAVDGEFGGFRVKVEPGQLRTVPYKAGRYILMERQDVHEVTDHPATVAAGVPLPPSGLIE